MPNDATRPRTRRTATRIAAAFAAVLLLFGAALLVVLATLGRIADAENEVAALDHAKHAGHVAAAQVREQYIHQAHTIINGDASHLGHYGTVVEATRVATLHLVSLAQRPEERTRAEEIAALAARNDAEFRSTILVALERDDLVGMRKLHDRMEEAVSRVVVLNDELNAMFEARSEVAREGATRLRTQARLITILCFGLAIGIATLVGALLMRSILTPIAALRRGAERVGAGDLTARIEITGDDEFAQLAGSFNQMTADLARNQRELVRTQKLASIGQVAAGVAHEINNPLGVILGYMKLLRREPELAQHEELKIVEDEALQCQRIVQGLLDLSRPPQLDVTVVDLADLARDAVQRLDEAGRLRDLSVTVPVAGTPARARADEAKIRQVILNLVLNAAEAASAGGQRPAAVTIEATEAGGDALLRVIDSGTGMTPEVQAKIFDPFFTTKRNGTGLGLAIAQAIVDAHGGRIEIEASSPETGTSVALRLPRAASAREQAA